MLNPREHLTDALLADADARDEFHAWLDEQDAREEEEREAYEAFRELDAQRYFAAFDDYHQLYQEDEFSYTG